MTTWFLSGCMSGIHGMWSATLGRGILHFLKWGEPSLMGVVRDFVF